MSPPQLCMLLPPQFPWIRPGPPLVRSFCRKRPGMHLTLWCLLEDSAAVTVVLCMESASHSISLQRTWT